MSKKIPNNKITTVNDLRNKYLTHRFIYASSNPKRIDTDIDIVSLIANDIGKTINDDYKDKFLNDSVILTIKDSPSDIQRFILNKYFIKLLLRFRARFYNKPVYNNLVCLIIYGTTEDWLKIFKKSVFPFIIRNKVFELMI